MANRVWQYHFGTAWSPRRTNLGQSGARPSHPELLDYLARSSSGRLSVKGLHRLIMNSAVYRQTGAHREDAFALDPDNRWLWRYPLRRLDAEAVRDGMLAVSASWTDDWAGRTCPRSEPRTAASKSRNPGPTRVGAPSTATAADPGADAPGIVRRPGDGTTCGTRSPSTVPLQSLRC